MKTATIIGYAKRAAEIQARFTVRLIAAASVAHIVGEKEGWQVKAIDGQIKESLTAFLGDRMLADIVKIGKAVAKGADAQFKATIAAMEDSGDAASEACSLLVASWQAESLLTFSALKNRYAPPKGAPRGNTATPKVPEAPKVTAEDLGATVAPQAPQAPQATAQAPSMADRVAAIAATEEGLIAMVAALTAQGYVVSLPSEQIEEAAA